MSTPIDQGVDTAGHAPVEAPRHRARLAIHLQNFSEDGTEGWQPMLDRALAADDAGIHRLLVSEHVLFGADLDDYAKPELGGIAGGSQPTGPDGHWLDPLIALAVVAGVTSRVRLMTSILLAALRRPTLLAKETASLDVLSGGRLDLGVGVGWQRAEYEAAGVPFEGRGGRLNEVLTTCKSLWTEQIATVHAGGYATPGIHTQPKPHQSGGVPIWISGRASTRVFARIVEHGSGWIPWGDDAADPARVLGALHAALTDAGRDPAELAVLVPLPVIQQRGGGIDLVATRDRVAEWHAIGVTDFRLPWLPAGSRAQLTDHLGELVESLT